MDSVIAIGVGLVLRIVVDVATDNDNRVGGVLVGMWEGVVLNHFVRRMPHSFDPYLGFGFRIFVDFLFTQSLSRLALVALWALVSMLLADIAPNIWRDSGFRHLYRQVRKDVRHVKRSVPRIRIKNDLPSVRLFERSRSSSGSIRSDRAAPSRSPALSPAPSPARRQGPIPPGTFPDVSGWSETNTTISNPRVRVVTSPGPSPALIPSREHVAYEDIDTTRVFTSQRHTQDTTITITQTQTESVQMETVVEATIVGVAAAVTSASVEPSDDPSRHNPLAIPDDWVDIDHPAPAKPNEPVAPLQCDPDPPPAHAPQPSPSSPTQSRPVSVLDPPPTIHVLPDIPDVDVVDKAPRPPDQIPLPESRAASVIGGVYDQPEPRSALRDSLRSRVGGKATSEIGITPAKPRASVVETQSVKSQSSIRTWTSKLKQSVGLAAPEPPPPKETRVEPTSQSRLDVGSTTQPPIEPQIPTPAQVDPPPNILTQPDTSPLLLKSEPGTQQEQESSRTGQHEQPPASAGVDTNPVPSQGRADKKVEPRASQTSLLDLPSPSRTPPPPFTEFAGVTEVYAAGEAPKDQDPVTQDEPPTELTKEQKDAEEKRIAFLMAQVKELEGSRVGLRKSLDGVDDPASSTANAIVSDLEDAGETLRAIKARIAKKKFSEPPQPLPVEEVVLIDKSVSEVQLAVTSAILGVLLERDDAGPMTARFVVGRKTLSKKAKDSKDAILAVARMHKFKTQSEPKIPGIINITF